MSHISVLIQSNYYLKKCSKEQSLSYYFHISSLLMLLWLCEHLCSKQESPPNRNEMNTGPNDADKQRLEIRSSEMREQWSLWIFSIFWNEFLLIVFVFYVTSPPLADFYHCVYFQRATSQLDTELSSVSEPQFVILASNMGTLLIIKCVLQF